MLLVLTCTNSARWARNGFSPRKEGDVMSLREIVRRQHLYASYLEQPTYPLNRAGLVRVGLGSAINYALTKPVGQNTTREVEDVPRHLLDCLPPLSAIACPPPAGTTFRRNRDATTGF